MKALRVVPVLTLIFLTVACLSLSLVHADVWSSGAVFAYDNGSILGLQTGGTATYDLAQNDGQVVTFSNLLIAGSTSAENIAITIDGTGIEMNLTGFDTNGWLNYTMSDVGTVTLTLQSTPIAVYIDGVLTSRWTPAWSYNAGVITINTAHSSVSIELSESSYVEERNNALNAFIANIFLALTLVGFVPLILAIFLFKNGTVDFRTFIFVLFAIIVIVIIMLIALLFMANMQPSFA